MAYPVIDQFGLDKYLTPAEAPAAAGAVPKAAPVAAGMKIPPWLKSAGKFLKGPWGVGTGLAAQGAGVMSAANETMGAPTINGAPIGLATPENRLARLPDVAGKVLGGADITGLGARIGRVATSGDWFEPDVNPIVGPATREFMARGPGAAPMVSTPVGVPLAPGDTGMSGGGPVMTAGGPSFDMPGFDQSTITSRQLPDGTGIIGNLATGKTMGIMPSPGGFGAVAPARYQPRTAAGGFMQAQLGLKEISGTNAAKVAAAKAASDAALKAAQGGEAAAKTSEIGVRMGLGAQAKARGASEAEVAGIVSGRPVSDIYKESVTSMPGKQGEVTLISGRTGAVQKVIPTAPVQKITGAHVDAALGGSMKGKTRAQVIQAYKDKGYDVSGIK